MSAYSQAAFFSSLDRRLLKSFFLRIIPAGTENGPDTWESDFWQRTGEQYRLAIHDAIARLPEKARRACNSRGRELYYLSRISQGAKKVIKIVQEKFPDQVAFKYNDYPLTTSNAAAIAFLESSPQQWRDFKFEYLKDAPYYKPWQNYEVIPVEDISQVATKDKIDNFQQDLSNFLMGPDGLSCGKYVLVEDLPLETDVVRGIIYYSDASFTDMGWLDDYDITPGTDARPGVQPVSHNKLGSIVFKYLKNTHELSMRFEENDAKILFKIATIFAKSILGAEIRLKIKDRYSFDKIKDFQSSELPLIGCQEVIGGRLTGVRFDLDSTGKRVASYKTDKDGDLVSEMKTRVFQEKAWLAGSGRIREITLDIKFAFESRVFDKRVVVTERALKTHIKDPEIKDIVIRALADWGFVGGT